MTLLVVASLLYVEHQVKPMGPPMGPPQYAEYAMLRAFVQLLKRHFPTRLLAPQP